MFMQFGEKLACSDFLHLLCAGRTSFTIAAEVSFLGKTVLSLPETEVA